MSTRILTRTAAVVAAAALTVSGAAGIAGAAESRPESGGSIPTSYLGSLDSTPIHQLVTDPEQFFNTSMIIPGSLILGSACIADFVSPIDVCPT